MNISELFGTDVFNDETMKTALPRDTYKALKKIISKGESLTPEVATVVANAMKTWAVEKGATHYTHWFQPMTGITAEKHDSFVTPSGEGVIMEFGGSALIQGEPDASSFPNGGLRATFEARGYTAWDPTSYAFIKDGVLCIPSVFYSYTGEALDKKTPLLRSIEVINKESLRILKLFGDNDTARVFTTLGVEQEFFLLDKAVYEERPDLIHTGRTLFGAQPPKGQELDDHYFGALKPRVAAYLKDLSIELWKMGIFAKTHHNEVAPSQHEIACVFANANVSADQNQIVMEVIKSLATKHDMVALLHEKPFAGLNGSGKHNNWSIATDTGKNLLEPGKNPATNYPFLLFTTAVIAAIDQYGPLLRASVATAANDHRLGGNEAPPAIISIYLGSEIEAVLKAYADKKEYLSEAAATIDLGISSIGEVRKDTTDRNRTSPFAFTGNKFEFRMPGSSVSVSEPNFILNTIVADSLKAFADELEKAAASGKSIEEAVKNLVSEKIAAHQRIIFNQDGYSDEWPKEAEKRGLKNLKTVVDAIPELTSPEALALFSKYDILSQDELKSRAEIMLEEYVKRINIEAQTMIAMTERRIVPAILDYERKLVDLALGKKQLGLPAKLEESSLKEIADHTDTLQAAIKAIKSTVEALHKEDLLEAAKFAKDEVIPDMLDLREVVDTLEGLVANWPFPHYAKVLHSV